MRLRLPELQDNDKEAIALRAGGLPEGWEDVEGVLQYQGLPYVLEIIRSKVISLHDNDPLVGYFGCNVVTRDQLTGPQSSRFDAKQIPDA